MATELKHTVMPSGGDFTSLDACMDHLVASHANLVTADVYATIEIDGAWSSADTTAVTLALVTTDATRYIHIYTTPAARYDRKWDTGAYMLYVANNSAISKAAGGCDHVRIDGLQIGVSASNANYQSPIWAEYTPIDGATWWLSNCILRGAGSSGYRNPGLYNADAQLTLYGWNNVIYNIGTLNHPYNSGIVCDGGTINLYSSTVIGGKYGVFANGGTINAKNVYAGGTLTEDFYRGAGTLAKTNCASEDQSADDTGTGETATNCVAAAVPLSMATFVNVTGGSEDFHIVVGSALKDAGVNTSGESAPLNFTTDIDGDAITGTWDIGADEYVAVGGPYTIVADGGSYALSGQPGDLLAARKVGADEGSYALSGQDAGALFGRVLAIEAGDYVLTGQAAGVLRAARIGMDGGTYVLGGQDAAPLFNRLISLGAGSYVLTGQDVGLIYLAGYTLIAEAGSYTLAGQAAALLKAHRLPLEAGAYVLTGQDAALLRAARLAVEVGSYVIAGQDVTLIYVPGGGGGLAPFL